MQSHPLRRLFRQRPRLLIATVFGFGIALSLPSAWPPITRILAGWDFLVWSYLILMWWLMLRASHARVRKIADQEDESAALILTILSIAAVLSLAAISIELATLKDLPLV